MNIKIIIEDTLKFLVYSNIYLAFGASCLTYVVIKLFGYPFDSMPMLILFLTTFFIYNLNRITDLDEDNINCPERVKFVNIYKYLLPLSIVGYIFALALALHHNFMTFLMSLIPFILGFMYSVFRLKKIFLLKDVIVALGWASIPFVVGAYFGILDLFMNTVVWVLVLFVFIRVFITTVVFDIKDIHGDRVHGIKTLPNTIGIERTRYLLYILNTLFGLFLLLVISCNILPSSAYILILIIFYCYLYISLIKHINNDKIVYGLLVDGEYIFMGIIMILSWFI